MEDGADAVYDGHEAGADGLEDGFDLLRERLGRVLRGEGTGDVKRKLVIGKGSGRGELL